MTELTPHAAHWGAFTAVVADGRVVGHAPVPGRPEPAGAARLRSRCGACADPHRPALCPARLARRRPRRRHAARRGGVRPGRLGHRHPARRRRGGTGAWRAWPGRDFRRQLRLVLGRAVPPCAHPVAAAAGGRGRLHRAVDQLLLCRRHDADAACRGHQRRDRRAGGGMARHRRPRAADALLRRHPAAQRPDHRRRRRAARDGGLGGAGRARRRAAGQHLAGAR